MGREVLCALTQQYVSQRRDRDGVDRHTDAHNGDFRLSLWANVKHMFCAQWYSCSRSCLDEWNTLDL